MPALDSARSVPLPEIAVPPMRSFRRIVLLAAALAALGGAIASAGNAAAQSATGALDGKLQREAKHLAASGFERIGGETIEAARKDIPSVVLVELDGAAVYAVVAACGGGCDHVEIALFDPAQGLQHRSPEKSDVVIVSGPARQSGLHGIGLSVPGCRVVSCPVGYVLLRQVPRAAPAQTSAASGAVPFSSAPAASGADAQAVQSELARLVVSAREAARARERKAAPVSAPSVTDAETAPGRPSSPVKSGAAPR